MKNLLFVVLLVCLSGCDYIFGEYIPPIPERHKNIPITAVWSGGSDGGSWFDCTKTKNIYERFCTVYTAYGEKTIESVFYLAYVDKDKNKIPLEQFLKESDIATEVVYFKGSFIDFSRRILLYPVDPIFPEDLKSFPEIVIKEP